MSHLSYPNILENISDKLFKYDMSRILMCSVNDRHTSDLIRSMYMTNRDTTIIIMHSSTDVTNRLLPYYGKEK